VFLQRGIALDRLSFRNKLLSSVLCVSLAGAHVTPAFAAGPDGGPISRAEYEACQARDEGGFRVAVEALTSKALQKGLATIDYKMVVDGEWRKAGIDQMLDKRIDAAVAEVTDETGASGRATSVFSKDKATELAMAVSERVYKSDEFKKAIEALANGVGREVAKTIELATLDAGEPALACMKAFLGPRYGETIAGVVSSDASREFAVDSSKATAQMSTGSVLSENKEGLAGAVVLLVRRQLSTMASRVGQRLAGVLLGRLVSVVAGGLGAVLIAKDIYSAVRYGVLPVIATEMKSKDSKDKVKEELAKAISEQISEHSKEIAAKTSERVVEIWHDFKKAHAKVTDLAEREVSFKRFVDQQKPEQIGRIDEIVAIVHGSEGEAGVMRRLADGTLDQGVNALAPAGLEIARDKRSLETALAWMALAGPQIAKVTEFDLHRRSTPMDFTKASLARVLGLGDRLAIMRLTALKRDARDTLLELDDATLGKLAKGLNETELDTLSAYLTGLEKPVAQRIMKTVAQTPGRMQALTSPRVRDAVLRSRDQMAAVDMLLAETTSTFEPAAIANDIRRAMAGQVSPVLLWDRHPAGVGAMAALGLIVLMMLKRLLFGRRRAKTFVPAARTDA
jgi:hypothetical protein